MRRRHRAVVPALVSITLALAGGFSVLVPSLSAATVTGARAVAIVKTVLAEGLWCDYGGTYAIGPWTAQSEPSGNWLVKFRLTTAEHARHGEAVQSDMEVDIHDGSVVDQSLFTSNVLTCAGGNHEPCANRRPALTIEVYGTPIARYGPIALYSRVPGLKITRHGSTWTISGLKVATKGGRWTSDDCMVNGGVISVRTTNVLYQGKPVAVVGDRIYGVDPTVCPAGPSSANGYIRSGDPRIAINGRPVAVSGSRVWYVSGCTSQDGLIR